MTTKTALDVPADPKWRHVIGATVLAALQASSAPPTIENSGGERGSQDEVGRMADLSLLLDRALDDIDSLAGVSGLRVEVEWSAESVLVTVVGEGEDIEPPPWNRSAPFLDPLTGSTIEWSQTAVSCSFRVAVGAV